MDNQFNEIESLNPAGIYYNPTERRPVNKQVVKDIAASMETVGQLSPIVVIKKKGEIELVVGAHRLEACKLLDRQVLCFVAKNDSHADELMLMEISENLHRSELSALERAELVTEWIKLTDKKKPKAEGVLFQDETKPNPKGGRPESGVRAAAREIGVDSVAAHRSIKIAGKLVPEARAVVVGTPVANNQSALLKIASAPKEEQVKLAKDLVNPKSPKDVKAEKAQAKKEARAKKEESLAAATIAASKKIGTKLYNVILADPSWRFEVYSNETGMDRAAENHYPTMDTAAIAEIKVPAAENAVCFMWATAPMIKDALQVLAAWGFDYKSQIIWNKDRVGMGYWVRNKHEILLIGTRGDIPAPAMGTQPPSVIDASVGRHSEKRGCFAEIIERLYPTSPKLEMFCRSPRPGWEIWGNEAGPDGNGVVAGDTPWTEAEVAADAPSRPGVWEPGSDDPAQWLFDHLAPNVQESLKDMALNLDNDAVQEAILGMWAMRTETRAAAPSRNAEAA